MRVMKKSEISLALNIAFVIIIFIVLMNLK
jgi:hypothetical protein